MFLVVGLHGSFESFEGAVDLLVDGNINFGRSGPEYNHAVNAGLLLEATDVLADLLGHVPAILAHLHVVAVETLGIVVVECSLHGLDGLELILHGVDALFP